MLPTATENEDDSAVTSMGVNIDYDGYGDDEDTRDADPMFGFHYETRHTMLRFCDGCGNDLHNDRFACCAACRKAGIRSLEDYVKAAM